MSESKYEDINGKQSDLTRGGGANDKGWSTPANSSKVTAYYVDDVQIDGQNFHLFARSSVSPNNQRSRSVKADAAYVKYFVSEIFDNPIQCMPYIFSTNFKLLNDTRKDICLLYLQKLEINQSPGKYAPTLRG